MDMWGEDPQWVKDWWAWRDRHPRFDRWLVKTFGERDPLERCPWLTPSSKERCYDIAGHRGQCHVKYANGERTYYYGINYPDGPHGKRTAL